MSKLFSRKLLVTLSALVVTISDLGLDQFETIVVGVVSSIYVLSQAFVDRATADRVVAATQQGVDVARKVSTGSLLLLCLTVMAVAPACTPAQRAGLPVLSTVDAMGVQLAQVLGWCERNDVDEAVLASAKRAAQQGDFGEAIDLAFVLLHAAGLEQEVPREVVAMAELIRAAAAAESIQNGMRAVSGGA